MKSSKTNFVSCITRAGMMAILAISVLLVWKRIDIIQKTSPNNFQSLETLPHELSYYLLEEVPTMQGINLSHNDAEDSEYVISFLRRVNKNCSAKMRYFDVTEEGDLVITDLSYDPDIEKFVFVYDCSRDAHSSKSIETFTGERIVVNSFGKTRICAAVQNSTGEMGYGIFSAVVNEKDFERIKKLFVKLEEKGMGTWIVEME